MAHSSISSAFLLSLSATAAMQKTGHVYKRLFYTPLTGTDLPSWNSRSAINPNLHIQAYEAWGVTNFSGGGSYTEKLVPGGTI